MTETSPPRWLYRRTVLPALALLRMGTTPERLVWSIAVGLVIGVNPLLGSTTLFCLAAASAFRLNLAASQLANHLAYPLQFVLLLPLLRLVSLVFHTAAPPLSPVRLLHDAETHPVVLMRALWRWEVHALVVWAAAAVVPIPAIALALTAALRRFQRRGGVPRRAIRA